MSVPESIKTFDEVARFLTYLRIAGERGEVVTVANALGTKLELRMDEDLNTYVSVKGSNNFTAWDCTLENMIGCVEYLKEQPPATANSAFASMWDEIFFETGAAKTLARIKN